MIVSKTRNAPGWATKEDNLIPNGVKCNENVIWVSVLRLKLVKTSMTLQHIGEGAMPGFRTCFDVKFCVSG